MQPKLRYTVFFAFVWSILLSSFVHPYYISVTEIKHNRAAQSIEISCRMFTDNIEDALKKIHKKPLDLLHPKDKKEADDLISNYVSKHLLIKADDKTLQPVFIGYEKEEEAIWCYFEIKNVKQPQKITLENSLLYDYLPDQTNMIHVTVNEKRQSTKLNNPDKKAEFLF